MTKEEYISSLRAGLRQLTVEDADKAADYCSEMIDDRMEEGMTQEEAVAAMDSPEETVRRILMEQPLNMLVKSSLKKKRRLTGLEITLVVLGAPLWLPLLTAACAVALSLYLVLWSLVAVLFAVMAALGISAVAAVIGAAVFPGYGLGVRLIVAGAGVVAAGLGILMFFAALYAAKGLIALTAILIRGIKGRLIDKKEKQHA